MTPLQEFRSSSLSLHGAGLLRIELRRNISRCERYERHQELEWGGMCHMLRGLSVLQ